MKFAKVFAGTVLGVGLLASTNAEAYFEFRIQGDLLHQSGAPYGDLWRASANIGPQGSFSTYGFDAGYINDGGAEVAIFTTFDMYPTPGQSLNTVWDIFHEGTTYSKRTYTVTQNTHVEASTVVRLAKHFFQPRTRSHGKGTVDQGNVQVYMEHLDKTKDIWPAIEQAGYHEVGRVTAAADWVAIPGQSGCIPSCDGKFMTYGPYVSSTFFEGPYGFHPDWVAIFHLQTDRGAGSSARIADVDVVHTDASGNTIYLGTRSLTGLDFPTNNAMTGIALKFSLPWPSPTNLQFRVRVRSSTATITQSDTKLLEALG